MVLEPEPKPSRCWSKSLKFEYLLHSLALQAKQWTQANCNLIIAWHQNSEPGSCALLSYRCQAKFLTYYCLSVILLLRRMQ